MNSKKINKLVIASLFTAIVTVATMVIRIPSLGGNGYVNIGDCAVLMCAWIIGGNYGALAAGLGSALADILSGYIAYAPGTFIIKYGMAIAAYLLVAAFKNKKHIARFEYILSAILAEIIMVVGYFIFEYTILGYGMGAAPAIISNAFQGITNIILAIVIYACLSKTQIKRISKI